MLGVLRVLSGECILSSVITAAKWHPQHYIFISTTIFFPRSNRDEPVDNHY